MSLPTSPPATAKVLGMPPTVSLFKTLNPKVILKEHPAQFASALAHEVRNPLTNINLAVEMLLTPLKEEDRKIYLDMILRASGRINGMVTDLLVSFDAAETPSEKYFIHQLLDEVLALTGDRFALKSIEVRKDYSTLDCKVAVDKQEIKIALTNIIINAIDAMPPGNGRLKLITRSVNNNCILEIQDNGVGIGKEDLKKIFTPYFTNKPGGMGLGLSTTLEILRSNHVIVDVRSEPGKGTSFILTFDKGPS